MAKSKRISDYPEQYFRLFQKVESDLNFRFGPMEKSRAHGLRFDLYGFRRALIHEGHPQARAYSRFKIAITNTDTPNQCYVTFTDPTEEFQDLFDALPEIDSVLAQTIPQEPSIIKQVEDEMNDILGDLGFNSEED